MTMMLGPGLLDGLFRQKIFIRGTGVLYENGRTGRGVLYHTAGTWNEGDLLVAWMGDDRVYNPADWDDYHTSNICNLETRYATSNSTDATPDLEDGAALEGRSTGTSAITFMQVIALASLDPSKQVYLNLEGTHIRESYDVDWLYGSIGAGPDAEETMVLHCYTRRGYAWRTTAENGFGTPTMSPHPRGTNIFTSANHYEGEEYWNGTDWFYLWAGMNYEYEDVSSSIAGGSIATPYPTYWGGDPWHQNDTKSFRFGLRTPP